MLYVGAVQPIIVTIFSKKTAGKGGLFAVLCYSSMYTENGST